MPTILRWNGLRIAVYPNDHRPAVRASYDRWRSRIVIRLDTGVDLAVPKRFIQGLTDAADADLAEIEISPTGLGLHWPRLDADIYVPGLLEGTFGSRAWMDSLVEDGDIRQASKRTV